MKDLEQCRKEIDEIDEQLMELFEKRMNLSKEVIIYKLANNLEIYQPDREKTVIEKNVSYIHNDQLKGYGTAFIQAIMDISKDYQEDFIPAESLVRPVFPQPFDENTRVGYQGVEGAFGQQAMEAYFGSLVQASSYTQFEDVFKALERDEIQYGIVPIENSSTGAINDVYDLIRNYGFYIVGEQSISIAQHLLGVPGSKIEDIEEVYSHQQGLSQTTNFLDQYPNIKRIPYANTAIAAKMVADQKDPTKAAIASKKAALLYGLDILESNIHNEKSNHTRFIVISKTLEAKEDYNRVSIVTTLKHEVGALESILKIIKDNHLNMCHIESRPMEEKNWEYYFYIDFEGNILDPNVKKALSKMKERSQTLRVLGTYKV